jgi:hypothetical protein
VIKEEFADVDKLYLKELISNPGIIENNNKDELFTYLTKLNDESVVLL